MKPMQFHSFKLKHSGQASCNTPAQPLGFRGIEFSSFNNTEKENSVTYP